MPETYDLIVRGGEVVNHAGRGIADVGVRGGKFVAVGDLGQASAGEVIDARGLAVLPGVIDSQVHFREPGLEWKEDLESGARAAVLGGVVAVFEMPNTEPTTTDADALADKLARAKGRMHCDHAFYVGGTHENARLAGRAGAPARLLRGQGVHGRLHRLPAGARRRGGGGDPAPTSTGAGPSTPRTSTAWPSAGPWRAPATGPATRRCATPARRSSPPGGW